mmetsp:Transcript_119720/g.372229  ORF Transcript_119720/g.372229 Transcript_119720/m.372229 type:complete len:109 (-) Transcript_119720:394-720(-)
MPSVRVHEQRCPQLQACWDVLQTPLWGEGATSGHEQAQPGAAGTAPASRAPSFPHPGAATGPGPAAWAQRDASPTAFKPGALSNSTAFKRSSDFSFWEALQQSPTSAP